MRSCNIWRVLPGSAETAALLLKAALPILALLSTVLGLRAEKKWNNERGRPTGMGYALIVVAILTSCAGLALPIADKAARDNDKARADEEKTKELHAAERRKEAELGEQRTHFQALLSVQASAFDVALRSFPVDEITIWIPRRDIEPALPMDFKGKVFAFSKRAGMLDGFDAFAQIHFPVERHNADAQRRTTGVSLYSLLDSMGSGALKQFERAYAAVCPLSITPSLVEEGHAGRYRVGNVESVLAANLERDYFEITYAPMDLMAAYVNRSSLRLARQTRAAWLRVRGATIGLPSLRIP